MKKGSQKTTAIQIKEYKLETSKRGGVVPSIVPHLVFLPSSLLPFTWYSWSLPTTANGIISCTQVEGWHITESWIIHVRCLKTPCKHVTQLLRCYISVNANPHPDLLVDHSVLSILIKFFLRVNIDPIGSQLFPDLVGECPNIHKEKHNIILTRCSFETIQNRALNCWSDCADTLKVVTRNFKQMDLNVHNVLIKEVLQLIYLVILSKGLGFVVNRPKHYPGGCLCINLRTHTTSAKHM